jgi:hypothetical protein
MLKKKAPLYTRSQGANFEQISTRRVSAGSQNIKVFVKTNLL